MCDWFRSTEPQGQLRAKGYREWGNNNGEMGKTMTGMMGLIFISDGGDPNLNETHVMPEV